MHLDPPHSFHASRPAADVLAGTGAPGRDELLAAYVETRGAGATVMTRDLDWFVALNHYKVVSTVAAIAKRNRRRAEPALPFVTAEVGHLQAVLARPRAGSAPG